MLTGPRKKDLTDQPAAGPSRQSYAKKSAGLSIKMPPARKRKKSNAFLLDLHTLQITADSPVIIVSKLKDLLCQAEPRL